MQISITNQEYGELTDLTAYPERVLTRQQILERLWRMDSDIDLNDVRNTICYPWVKIEKDRKNPVYITNMPRSG